MNNPPDNFTMGIKQLIMFGETRILSQINNDMFSNAFILENETR